MTLNNVVVPNILNCCSKWLTSLSANAVGFVVLLMGFLNLQERFLSIKSRILGQSSWHNQQCICKCMHTKLDLSRYTCSCHLHQVLVSSDFECSSSRYDALVFNCVLYRSQSISDSLLCLSNGVIIWAFDQNSAREWVVDSFNKGILVVPQNLLVDTVGMAKVCFRDVIDRI